MNSYVDENGYFSEYRQMVDRTTQNVPYRGTNPGPLRAQVLDEAKALITGDRNKSYGSPIQNFQNTADLWSVQFGHLLRKGERFTPSHVAQAMVLLKMARMIAGKKQDNWTDVVGYAGCGAECDEAES